MELIYFVLSRLTMKEIHVIQPADCEICKDTYGNRGVPILGKQGKTVNGKIISVC